MAEATDAVWLPVLPSMRGFGPAIIKGAAPQAERAGKRIGGQFRNALITSVGALGSIFAVGQVTQFFKAAVVGAGELQQSVGAIESVFGKSAGQMQKWSQNAAKDVGLTKNEFNELGTLIGAQLKNGGTAMDQLAPKTNKLIGLGADLSSMFGGTTKDAVAALSSALKGERDPIESYGVSLTQAKIDAEAAALGFKKVGGNLSAEATQAATLSLIMKQTTDAHGNFAKEADTFAGKQQRMNAQWGNLTTKVGKLFLPAMSGAIGFMSSKVLPVFEDVVGGVKAFGSAFTNASTDLTGTGIVAFMGRLGVKARAVFDYFKTNVLPVLKNLGTYVVATLIPAIAGLGRWFLDNRKTIATIVGVITALLLPVLIRMGVRYALVGTAATGSAIKQVAAWVMAQGAAVKAGAVYLIQSYKIIGTWVAMGLAALKSGLQTVAIWAMYKLEAIKAAGVYVTQKARIIAAWVAMSAAAVASGIKTAAVWTGQVVRAAVMGATRFLVSVGRVIAGWSLMAVRSLFHAARMAAAWIIALGPIAWVTAAVIAIVALVIANWDKIVKWTKKLWSAVVDWIVGAWRKVKRWTIDLVTSVIDWITRKFNAWVKFNIRIWRTIWHTVRDAWQTVKRWTTRLLLEVIGWIVGKFEGLRDTGRRIWNALRDIIGDAWRGVRNKVRDGWHFIRDNIFRPLKDFITKTIPNAFRDGVKGIKGWWNDLERVAKKPVKFMIDTVYNKGIRGVFNNVMDFVGSDLRLPELNIKGFRKGGYTGTMGRDKAAGVVHGQEWVLPAGPTAELRRTRPGFLEAITSRGAAALPGYKKGGFVWPVSKRFPITQYPSAAHPAYDIGTPIGTPVHAAAAGRVTKAGPGYRAPGVWGGTEAWIGHGGVASLYAHLSRLLVGIGDRVSKGQRIALSGNTGISSGPHLHFGAFRNGQMVSPGPWLSGKSVGGVGGGGFSLVDWIADKVIGPIKGFVSDLIEKIPGLGKFADMAVAVGKYVFEKVKDWGVNVVTPGDQQPGLGNAAVLHDNGGYLQPGLSAVLNNTRKPEAVLNPRQWDNISRLALQGPARVEKVTLEVGGEQFPAYLRREAVTATGGALNDADDRITYGGKYVGGLL